MAYDGVINFGTALDVKGVQDGTSKMTKIVATSFAAVGAAATAALVAIGKVGIGYNAQMEDYTTNFATMLGSQEAAVKKVEALKEMAAKTPFGMEDLAQGTQTLLAFGIESDQTMDILRQLGDVSLGNKDKFSSLTLAFAQMSSTGRLMGQDLNQMINAGFNPLQVISEKTGESMADLKKKMEEGAISSEMVAEAFALATSEGGKFYNGMEAASKTLHGQWSTLKDDAAAAAGVMFQPFNDVLSSRVLPNIIALVADLTENLSSPRMQSAMTKIAEGFGKLIEITVKLVSTALPPLIDILAALVDSMDVTVPIAVALGAAFVALKAKAAISSVFKALSAAFILASTQAAALAAGSTAAASAMVFQTTAQKALTIAFAAGNVIKAAAIAIMGLFTGSSVVATGATLTLGGALHALGAAVYAALGPFGLALAAIVAIVAVIALLVAAFDTSSEAYKKQSKELEELTDAHEEYNKQLDEDQAAAEQTIAKTKAQSDANSDLVTSLRGLMSTNDKAGSNNAAIAQTIDQLNKSVDGLGLSYDETTGKLSSGIDEVEKYVKAQGQLNTIKAQEDEYNRLLGEQLDLQAKIRVEEERQKVLAEQLDAKVISEREYNKLIKSSNELLKEYGATEQTLAVDVQAAHAAIDQAAKDSATAQVNAFNAVNGALDAEGRNLKQLANQYGLTTDQILAEMSEQGLSMEAWSAKKAEMFTKEGQSLQGVATQWGLTADEVIAQMDEMGMSLDEYAQHMEDTHTKEGLSLDDLAAKWGTTTEAIQTEMDNMGLSMQEWSDQQQAAWEDYEEAVTARTEGVINSFKKIPGEYDQSAQEMLEILINNKARYAEWEIAMEEITKQLGPTAAAEFAKLGPEATSAMQEILGSADLLDQYRETFGVKIDEATGAAVENWNDPNFIGAPSTAIDTSAQQLAGNTSLPLAATGVMEGTKTAANAVDFSEVGQNIAAEIVGGLNGADVTGAMNNITAAIQGNTGKVTSAATNVSTSVQNVFKTMSTQTQNTVTQMMTAINSTIVSRTGTIKASITSMGNGITAALNTAKTQAVNITTQMMTGINSAIVSRASTVKASMTSCANGVITALTEMKTKSGTLAEQMMTNINSAIVSRSSTVKSSAAAVSKGIVDNLQPMVKGAAAVANSMMDGIGTAMDNKAEYLYKKARAIAREIAETMEDALDVHSPSRVMIGIFENVMLGIYEGMDGMSGMLFREAESIADGLAERLTISPDVANTLAEQLRGITEANPLGGITLTPQAAYAVAGGGARYTTSLTQNITTPKPLSASEMTREGQDLLRRSRWQLP